MEKKNSKSSKNNQLIAQTFRSYLSMSILITLSATLGMMIDNVIAGQTMGADAVGAIGMSTPLLMLFSGCAGILETGAVTLSARALGKRDSNQVNALFSIALIAGFAIGLLCLLVGHFGSGTIASLLGADDPRLFEGTKAFITGLSLGALPIILLQLVMGFVRLDGSPQLGLVAILTMSVCDVSFNLIAVLVLDAGLLGMGTSTALAYYIALAVASTHFFKKKCSLKLVNPLPYISNLGTLLKTGMPDSMVRACVMLRTFTYNNLLLMVSTASAVAALSMLTSVNMFLSAVSVGVGQTATLLCGIFFGEQDRDAIKGTVMVALKTGMALCLLLCVLVFIFAPTVVSFFGLTDPEAKALGVIAVRVYCFAVPLDLVNNVFARYYQSSGNLKGANLISAGQTFVCGVVFALISVWFLGALGIWISFVFSQAATLVIQVVVAIVSWRKKHAAGCSAATGLASSASQEARAFDPVHASLVDKMLYLPDGFQSDWKASAVFECGKEPGDAARCSEEVADWCRKNGIDSKRSYLLSLAVEEMAGNIAQHGFAKTKKPAIDIRLVAKEDDSIILRIRDNGVEFNPMDYDIASDDSAKCIGIKLVRSTMTNMDYHSTVGLNNVVITL